MSVERSVSTRAANDDRDSDGGYCCSSDVDDRDKCIRCKAIRIRI